MRQALRREAERTARRGGRRSIQIMSASTSGADAEPPDLYQELQRFWWRPPDQSREETEASPPGRSRTTVRNGELWWTYSPESGAISNVDLEDDERARHSAGSGERFEPLLDPSPLLALLEFGEVVDEATRYRVRTRPREAPEQLDWRFHGLAGADEVELEVDRETGVVWRMRVLFHGEEIWSSSFDELVLNEPLPDDVFVFVPPPGVEVLPPETAGHRRRYTLEEAAGEAGFQVFFVSELPEGNWRLHVNFHPPRQRPPMQAQVVLMYSRGDGRGALLLAQRRAGGGGGFAWTGYGKRAFEELDRDGQTYTISRADPEWGQQNSVAFERDGTSLQLQSAEVDVEALLLLATALEPVSPTT